MHGIELPKFVGQLVLAQHQALVGRNIGAGNAAEAKRIAWIGGAVAACISAGADGSLPAVTSSSDSHLLRLE